jgi:hypothetical protein
MKLSDDEVELIQTLRSLEKAKVTVIIHQRKIRGVHAEFDLAGIKGMIDRGLVPRGTEGEIRTEEKRNV